MASLKELERLLASGRISRRDFMARASALGVTAAVSTSLMAGPAWAAKPKRGGRLRLGVAGGSTTDSLDPATITDAMAQNISFGQLRNCLVEIDADSNPIPELAESWEASADAARWVFKIRKGVEFHNGKTLDSEDVVYSINHHRGKDSKSAAKGIVDPIKDVKADGKHTVIFTLAGGNADFPFIMSDYHLSIVPAGTKGKEFEKGVGTGGYVLVSHDPGVRALTKRNPNYWKEGRAFFDEVETIGIADVNARTNALKTDEIDAMNRAELKTVDLLKRLPGIQIIEVTGTKHYTFAMRTDMAPYDDNHVRLALKYAIDREQMLKTILRGHGALGNDHPIATANRYHADIPQRVYDPDKAKFHLKKAGLSSLSVKLHAADAAFGGAVDAAVLYRENAAKANIDIEVVREPNDGYWSNVWMKKAWTAVFWSGRATEDWMFSIAYAADAKWNDTFWKHDRFNQLLVAARAELDDAKRRQMYGEMQQIVRDEGGVVIPMFANDVQAARSRVKFNKVAANWELDGHKSAERWWFA